MRDLFAPVIEGFDCSGITNHYSLQCEPFYVSGDNGGVLMNGDSVSDALAVRSRLSWTLNSVSDKQYAALTAALDSGDERDAVTATAFDPAYNAVRRARFRVERPDFWFTFDADKGKYMSKDSGELVLEEIEPIERYVVTPPTKTDYFQFDSLDLAGLSATRYDKDENADDITAACDVSPANGTPLRTVGVSPVSVSFGGAEIGRFCITVRAATYSVTPPDKLTYFYEEALDLAGLTVTRRTADGTEADITSECAVSPEGGTPVTVQPSVNVSLGGTPLAEFPLSIIGGDWWRLSVDGTLSIYCVGNMPLPTILISVPWENYRDSILRAVISDTVTDIGFGCFANCLNLTSVTIPNSVKAIGGYAFGICPNLSSFELPDNLTSIGQYAFRYVYFPSITFPPTLRTIGKLAFYGASFDSLNIPATVKTIGQTAFQYSAIHSLTIANGVTTIEGGAFNHCYSLNSVTIPDSVTSLGGNAFARCPDLEAITISKNVTVINSYTFQECAKLSTIEIPAGVTKIGSYAFYKCAALRDVYYGGTEEQWNAISIASYNTPLKAATIHYNSSAPEEG